MPSEIWHAIDTTHYDTKECQGWIVACTFDEEEPFRFVSEQHLLYNGLPVTYEAMREHKTGQLLEMVFDGKQG